MMTKFFSPQGATILIGSGVVIGSACLGLGYRLGSSRQVPSVLPVEEPRADLFLPFLRVFNQLRSIWRGKLVDTEAVLDSDSLLVSRVLGDLAQKIQRVDARPAFRAVAHVAVFLAAYQLVAAYTAPPAGSNESLRILRKTAESRSVLNKLLFYFSFQRTRERAALRQLELREANRKDESSHWLGLTEDERLDLILNEVGRPTSRHNIEKKTYAQLLLTELLEGKVVDTESNAHDITVALQRIVTQSSTDLENEGRLIPSSGNVDGYDHHLAWLATGGVALSRGVLNSIIRDAVRKVAPAKLVRPNLNGQQGHASATQFVAGAFSWQRVSSATSTAAKFLGTLSQFLGIRIATE